MALTAVTTLDVIGQTSTPTFNNPSQVDQITFGSNQITYQTCSSYNLIKSDCALYIKFLTTWYNSLLINFLSLGVLLQQAWPLSVFDITTSSSGVTHIIYTQQSQGTQVISINYVPTAASAGVSARSSPVTISVQELFMGVYMKQQYFNQIAFN